MTTKNEGAVVVRQLPPLKRTGKPNKIATSAMRVKMAYGGGSTVMGMGGNFYSPELSTDFLELAQSKDEKRNYFRFFYRTNGVVHGAVNFNTIMPLSKVRLEPAKAKDKKLAAAATRFCEKWASRIKLLDFLMYLLHDLNLIGQAYPFAEDSSPEEPRNIREEEVNLMDEEGNIETVWRERPDANQRAFKWLKENYKGWTKLLILPPEQVKMKSFTFTEKKLFEFIPDNATKSLINDAQSGDKDAVAVALTMPVEIVRAVVDGANIRLGNDPYAGSFVECLSTSRSQYESDGISMLEPLIRALVHQDKLRQSQASIASRHMTPYRIVYAENLNQEQLETLREQVDLCLADPDFSVIANYQLTWEERGAENRLLNLSDEYDRVYREVYASTGTTEGLLTGESVYSGERTHLEVINQRFMLVRQKLQNYVDDYLLKPMCARMGFVETDEDGDQIIVAPRLSFTRLTFRDSQDMFDILFNLYQKGSLPIGVIYEHLNINQDRVEDELARDMFTVRDASYNDLLRGLYGRVADDLAENSDLAEQLAVKLNLKYTPPADDEGGRF